MRFLGGLDRFRSTMRLVRLGRPIVRRGACRSPCPTRDGHVERGRGKKGPGKRGEAEKPQRTRWATRKLVKAKTGGVGRAEARIEARTEEKGQAPGEGAGHKRVVTSGRSKAEKEGGNERKWT